MFSKNLFYILNLEYDLLNQGFRSFVWTAVSYLLKDKLKLSPSASQFVTTIAFFPWSIKPVYGYGSNSTSILMLSLYEDVCSSLLKENRKSSSFFFQLLCLIPHHRVNMNFFLSAYVDFFGQEKIGKQELGLVGTVDIKAL